MKISWYTDSPRARTHAGRLSCIDALSVDSDSSHDAPPNTKPTSTAAKYGHQRQHHGGHGEAHRRHGQQRVLTEAGPQPRQQQRARTAPTPSAPSSRP